MQIPGFQCPPRFGGGDATTLKKVFKILTLFGFLSASFFGLLLLYNGTLTFNPLTRRQHGGSAGNDTLETQAGVQQVQLKMRTPAPSVPREEEEEGTTPAHSTQPCPDNPPDLVGPLAVEFSHKLTLDEVRRKVSSPLREGGRYHPPDCVSKHKVAVIIPFRNRHEHLNYWLYYLHPILLRQQLDYGVYLINQDGEGVFNRAKLMNVGYVEALKDYDYNCFVFSDIDLIPMNDRNLYRCFDNPRHLAVAMDKFNFQLPYNSFFGGVSSLSKDQYLKINGFPNTYWGWGGEDDDIYGRISVRGMSISRPDLLTGKYKMIKHERDLHNEQNPENPGKLSQTQSTMDQDGINSLNYTVKEIVKDILYTYITVDIQGPPR
ncbi:beta-1,4-galactosyltransferase 1-like [Hippoglossus hippoglossus]|uniref:beta-1,4-galactosyltransferase 1-like n=1 Tax=Hippoglossus hippoglossus TaxID=8267 RepID=UPI00148E5C60|nr:beta-1,4-galactosyltransferase 1-like [Hippoglossus hippoglossus]